ncbi:Uncharacterised protein [uncultured archaeon]|nr:Uncharacterised protein [uncultured archaeon]
MPKMMNGRELAYSMAARKMGERASGAYPIVEKAFKDVFTAKPPFENPALYHQGLKKVLMLSSEQGVPADISLVYTNMLTDPYIRQIWKDASKGQDAVVFLATNSSEFSSNLVFFGGDYKVHNGTQRGCFGHSMNARHPDQVNEFNDLVPFAFKLNDINSYNTTHQFDCDFHEHQPPVGIFFLGVYDSTQDSAVSQKRLKTTIDTVNARKSRFVDAITLSGHMPDSRLNYRFEDYQERLHLIPIRSLVYDTHERTIRIVDEQNNLNGRLVDYFRSQNLHERDPRVAEIIASLEAHEQDGSYSAINKAMRLLKEIGCVDLRITNYPESTGLIKEIGSVMREDERVRVAQSQLTIAAIISGHTLCGYNGTGIKVHNTFYRIGRMFDGGVYQLRDYLTQMLQRIKHNNQVGLFLPEKTFMRSIEDFESKSGHKIDGGDVAMLKLLVSEPNNDTRKTIRHFLKRNKADIGDNGLFFFRPAETIERTVRELLPPGTKLAPEHLDYLVMEESVREEVRIMEKTLQSPNVREKMANARDGDVGFDVTGMGRDVRNGNKTAIEYETPDTVAKLNNTKRSLFWDSKVEVEVPHTPGISE